MPVRRQLAALLVTAALLTACDLGDGAAPADPPEPSSTTTPTAEAASGPEAPLHQRCIDDGVLADGTVADPLDAWTCADVVVVASGRDALEQAVPVAGALGGPVALASDPGLDALLARLAPARVVEVHARTRSAVVLEGATRAYVALADDADGRTGAALLAARDGLPLVVVPSPPTTTSLERLEGFEQLTVVTVAGDAAVLLERLRADAGTAAVRRLPASSLTGLLRLVASARPERAWVVDDADHGGLLALAPLAVAAGHEVVVVPGLDLLAPGAGTRHLSDLLAAGVPANVPPSSVRDRGAAFAEGLPRRLGALASGVELPGGGWTLAGKRFVAMYGVPGTASLGVLGEQSLDATVDRLRQLAATYDDGSATVVPTFELIATVAAAGPTDDGDYSYGISHDVIREWVDRAALEGFQVVLDLQSGRSDFLSQARQLEEFLVQPHVGLALDPEWRLGPDQVHLRQIGSVGGAEVNTVVDWLVELTRQHDLPQKLLVLHQFQQRMIRDRDVIRTPDELLVALHMDGQGSLGSKYATYRNLFGDGVAIRQGLVAGWKNFFDEDSPMADPAQVLALDPPAFFITFQ